MKKKIAILRGINVGGKRKILMANLKSLCEELGLVQVKSYIQSGNLIFASSRSNAEIEKKLENAISEQYGFDVPVIVRSAEKLQTTVNKNPYVREKADISRLHLTFLKEKPDNEKLEQIKTYNYEPDTFIINDTDVFIFCEGKYHKSKLSNSFFEKNLNTGATTRNWKTVLKLLELSQ